ncbi:CTP synthase C-terminal region-related (seleno)protein [Paenibacillus humicus]|uniref:CTP synthase C-terminal region-related (seleno)protein n=1 Tax=Paenibacillus humicus TaxID=412861 RepID=UPI000FDC661C|nr:hypothetical protein [Paenibacillus humicus]
MNGVKIALIGDFNEEVVAHGAIPQALRLSAGAIGAAVEPEWVSTDSLQADDSADVLATYEGMWITPGSPYRSMQGALNAIRHAREHSIPLIGSCGGFQHMVIEFARNRLGMASADHAEENPDAEVLLVAPLTCSVSNQSHRFKLATGSRVEGIYDSDEISEPYGICNYGPNPIYIDRLEAAGFKVSGTDLNGEIRIMELNGHPFFMGTLFQPERSALQGLVHPLITEFVRSVVGYDGMGGLKT